MGNAEDLSRPYRRLSSLTARALTSRALTSRALTAGILLLCAVVVGLAATAVAGETQPSGGEVETCPAADRIAVPDQSRRFVQHRRIAGLPRPVVSSGLFQNRDGTFVWQVCDPFDIRTEIDDAGIRQLVEGEEADGFGSDALQGVIRSMRLSDILRGRFDGLQDAFEVDRSAAAPVTGPWTVTLVPRDAGVRAAVTDIRIAGCQAVREIRIDYRSGGQDTISVGDAVAVDGWIACPE